MPPGSSQPDYSEFISPFPIDRPEILVYYFINTLVQRRNNMDFKTEIPIYLQVMRQIQRDIVTGTISPGQKLPSVRELAVHYTINPNTASRVYRELENENICFTRRGMGTFATDSTERIQKMKEEMAQGLIRQFIEGMAQLGFSFEETITLIENERKGDSQNA